VKRAEMQARRVAVTGTQRHGIIHAMGSCTECGAEWGSRNALALGKQHAVLTGHEVHVEQCLVYIWNGRQ